MNLELYFVQLLKMKPHKPQLG